jgi:RHS repeat-associated protein/uncharacterized repeat protein (TIGR01451 family)
MEITVRVFLTAVMLFNALVPTAALASSGQEADPRSGNERQQNLPRSLPEQNPVFFDPPQITYPQQTSPEADVPESPVPPRDPVEFTIVADPAVVPANGLVTFHVSIRNHSEQELTSLVFTDSLEVGLEYSPDSKSPVTYDSKKKQVQLNLERLGTGEEFTFNYSATVTSSKRNALKGKVWLHSAELKSAGSNLNLKTSVAFGHALSRANTGSGLVPLRPEGGWNDLGRVAVHMDRENVGKNALVMSSPAKVSGKGPALQFNLDVFETSSLSVDAASKFSEQAVSLTKESNAAFKNPAFLEINLDGYIDLTNVPAGQEPYVATYDEEHKIWVKVPIVETDPVTNSVTVQAAHFSTWGAGLGSSLPQNGANVLLFDQPYTSLFTGSSRYSIPIWTPPGRAGMQPEISLSYSSGTVDGVLGDVQAPWVGVGWNIDDVEVVRKITTDENGYGYRNEFALTLNGALYQLVRDEFHQNRYFTDQAAFLYIERHNYALDSSPGTANITGEWWEVVTTDGTRYRLGWNEDSEQLALMYGYACTTDGLDCITPDGAYASLGYAGKAKDLVALRWRVDRVSDAHGNYMEYSYSETQPDASTTLAPFDRESYLQSIQYAGFEDPDDVAPGLAPAYQIVFNYGDRSTIGDVPTEFNIWDNLDSKYLSEIRSCYKECDSTGSIVFRKYQFGYSLANVPNSNGTLTLTSLKITGGGYTENGQSLPTTDAPTIRFTYQDKDNRASGNGDVFKYPRLATIDNGSGGLLTFNYEHDGRANNSWYNYRVQNVIVDSGMGVAKKQSYSYVTPVYSGQGGNPALGSLTGYTTVTESLLDFSSNDAPIVKTKHTFGTTGLDIGRELQTELLNSSDTVLRKTTSIYVTDNSGAPKDNNGNPFPGWNYRYLGESASYERSGGSLTLISKSTYYNDPFTGNLLLQSTYMGNSLYRKTYYEYVTNPDIQYYILDKVSRVLLVNAANQIYSDTRYHYDGQVNQAPTRGDVTLVQRLTGTSNQTIDTVTDYNFYGNAISARAYQDYGTVNLYPTAAYWESTIAYDSLQNDPTQSYPVSATNALGQSSSTAYLHTLGVPYQTTDPNGWTTSTSYDGLGRTLSVTPPGLSQPGTWYIYPSPDANGKISAPHSVEMQILDTIAGQYRSVWGIYDGAGRMIQTQVDAGNKLLVNSTLFNAQGLARQQSLPYEVSGAGGNYVYDSGSQFTTTEYDALGRAISVTAPGGITSLVSYDSLTTTATDPNGNKVSRTTDGLGRMVSVAEFSDASTVYGTTTYFYDTADRLIQVKDAKFNNTTIQYDWLGRKLGMDDPDMGIWSYGYDALGNMTSQTDARGQELIFTYDALNRLKKKSDGNEATVDPVYDYGTEVGVIGLRIGMTDPSGSSSWSYSNYGRTVTETRTIGGEEYSVTTNADWLGRAVKTTYKDGEVLTYEYDDLGRPDQLKSDQEADTLVDLAYNVLGQIESQTLGNGVRITNDYDLDGEGDTGTTRLQERKATNSTGTVTLLDLSYDYDANGNITRLTDTQLNETQFYNYDFLNRLTSAIGAQGIETAAPVTPETYGQEFEYDQVGNIEQLNNWGTAPTLEQGRAPSDDFAFVNYTDPKPKSASVGKALFAPAYAYQLEATATPTETPTPTETGTPTATNTPVPTNTPAGTSTPSITPSLTSTVTPIPNNANTVTLLRMNGVDGATTFVDETGKAWTRLGNAQIDTAQSVFGGASGLFDGSGDYLTAPDSDDFYFNGDFTIDSWVRFNSTSTTQFLFQQSDRVTHAVNFYYQAGALVLQVYSVGGLKVSVGQTWSPAVGTWYHVALVRSGNDYRMFVDGTQLGATLTDPDAIPNVASEVYIGSTYAATYPYNGWLDDFRISRGIARWTSNFTPPAVEHSYATATPTGTATYTPTVTPTRVPVIDDSYTVSLSHMNGADTVTVFPDESGKAWTAVGNAQVDTGQSVFGGASAFFDGTADGLQTVDSSDFTLGSENWTIDLWVKRAVTGTSQGLVGQNNTSSLQASASIQIYIASDKVKVYLVRNDGISTVTATSAGTIDTGWHHIAVVRNGDTVQIYIDGVADGSASVAGWTINDSSSKLGVGMLGEYTAGYSMNGWIDEFRFSKGIARWTGNFTPPTSEYTPAAGVPEALMAHWNFDEVTGTTAPDVAPYDLADNSATLQNGAATVLDGASGSAAYFDGSDDSAAIVNQAEIKKNSSFTLSAWINPSSLGTNRTQYLINKGVSATDFDYGFITTSTSGTATPTPPANVDANGKLVFRVGDLTPNKVIGPVLPINTWTLVTGMYDSTRGELRLYVNGTLAAVEKVTGTVSMGTGALSFSPAGNLYHGKLDEVRFYNRALTDQEVSQLFGTFGTPTPLPSITPTATSEATFTPTATALPMSAQQWGTGNDDDLVVSSTFNLNANTNGLNERTCADAVAYSVTTLGSTIANLSTAPAVGCLNPGDEVMLINLKSASPNDHNAGAYEFLRVGSISGNSVLFATMKSRWYGDAWHSDANIGVGAGQQRVMLMRVPNYEDVTVTGTLTASGFDGYKHGVVAFRVAGTLSGTGAISANSIGYPGGVFGVSSASGYSPGGGAAYNGGDGAGTGSDGGGGGHASAGGVGGYDASAGAGGSTTYGAASLSQLFMGSGGGVANIRWVRNESGGWSGTNGPDGGDGGGILFIAGQTINFTGSVVAIGQTKPTNSSGLKGGAGAGGNIRIEGDTVTLGGINAGGGSPSDTYGYGGKGRIAVYYQTSLSAPSINPPAYTGMLGQGPTLTPSPTPISFATPSPYGTGADGILTVAGTFNLNANMSGTRVCADGIAYSVIGLVASSARLSTSPLVSCLATGDEILLIHLSGSGPNIGKFEYLRVGGVVGDTVYFKTPKVNFYGSNATDDSGVGSAQRVMLLRVPNYNNVTVNGTLTASGFDGYRHGVVAFRVAGTLSGTGAIAANSIGFPGAPYGALASGYSPGGNAWYNGESGAAASGGGGGYATAGRIGGYETTAGAAGSVIYGNPQLSQLFMGSGGGAANIHWKCCWSGTNGPGGGAGGGIVFISGDTINFSGSVSAVGSAKPVNSTVLKGGAGAGGSIRIEGNNITMGWISAAGGSASDTYGAGGTGRTAIYYATSLTNSAAICAWASTYCENTSPISTPTATPTSTPLPEYTVEYLVIAGGAGGSNGGNYGGGGGAGQLQTGIKTLVPGTVYSVTVGNGGAAQTNGANSVFADITSVGGIAPGNINGGTSGNGYTGGTGANTGASVGGGGGAGSNGNGGNTSGNMGGTGGPGTLGFDGVIRAGGGGGAGSAERGSGTAGGKNASGQLNGLDAAANTGSGGGGAVNAAAGKGGSGIVIVRYLTGSMSATGGTVTTSGSYTIHTFTSGGTFTIASPTTAPEGWYASDYTYSTNIPHAVTSVERGSFTDSFTYDENGNMTCRTESGLTYLQTYSAENRIASIQKLASGTCAEPGNLTDKWDFTYDGDGTRTGQSYTLYTDGMPGAPVLTRYYFGGAYETTGSTWKKYYSFAGQTIMRDVQGLKYFLSDHLGSTSVVLDDDGTILEQQRYLPFGGVRTDLASPGFRITNTDFTYTGQRDLPDTGLMDYKARFYSPTLGRFIQPDTIIPKMADPQSWNRFSYVINNPLRYTDPTGHEIKPPPCFLCNMLFSYASNSGIFVHDGFVNNALDMVIPLVGNLYPGGVYVNDARDTVTFGGAEDYYPALMNNVVIVGADVVIPTSLYALGNASGPREPRIEGYNLKPGQSPDIHLDADGLIIPGQGGASTFETIEQLSDQGLSGHVWELPKGSSVSGLDDVADGIPFGSQPPGHHSLVPKSRDLPKDLIARFNGLPWRQVMDSKGKPFKLRGPK